MSADKQIYYSFSVVISAVKLVKNKLQKVIGNASAKKIEIIF